jgi:hypothetical protein
MDLPHAEAWVLMALADHADHEGRNIYPGMGLVAWKTGYSRRQVQRIVNALQAKGILVLEAINVGKYGTNRYRIDWSACTFKQPYRSDVTSDMVSSGQNVTSDKKTPPLVTKRHSASDIAMSPKPSVKPSIEPSRGEGRLRARPLPDDFTVTDEMKLWAKRQLPGLDVRSATETWLDAMRANTSKYKYTDWQAAWRNGMKMAAKWELEGKRNGRNKPGYTNSLVEAFGALAREAADLVEEPDYRSLPPGRATGS